MIRFAPLPKITKRHSWTYYLFVITLVIGFGVSMPQVIAFASVPIIDQASTKEVTPQELTYEAGFIVTIDLEDPNGIDPELLPEDVALLVDSNTIIVAFRATKRPDTRLAFGFSSSCNAVLTDLFMGIPCDTYDQTRDLTTSKLFGGITQFNRVYALRYDNYSQCAPNACVGWEFEQQWAKWTRTGSAWTVGANTAKMRTHASVAEDFCTTNSVTLDHQSTWFTPTFTGNSTNWWTISGFANIAYVPFPKAISYTQGDLYESGVLKTDNAQTTQSFSYLTPYSTRLTGTRTISTWLYGEMMSPR